MNVEKPSDYNEQAEFDDRISYFAENKIDFSDSDYHKKFLQSVKVRINNEKAFINFKNHIDSPFKITGFLNSLAQKIKHIFNASDRNIDALINISDKCLIDFNFFKTKVFSLYATKPNSVLVIDYDNTQKKHVPVLIPSDAIETIEFDRNLNISSIKYKITDEIYASVDEEKYDVIDKDGNKITDNKEYKSGKNIFKKCPAIVISSMVFDHEKKVFGNFFSDYLEEIKTLHFLFILKEIMSPKAFYLFLIKSVSAKGCDYTNGAEVCQSGFLYIKGKDSNLLPVYERHGDKNFHKACPVCNKSLGVGNEIGVPYSFDRSTGQLATAPQSPVSFIHPSTEILKYNDEYLSLMKNELYYKICGGNESLNPRMNHNETAYLYNAEDRLNVLNVYKSEFERLINFVVNLFDEDKKVNLGTKFILYTQDQIFDFILKDKDLANEIGLMNELIRIRYANDKVNLNKALVLNHFKNNIAESGLSDGIPKKIGLKGVLLSDFVLYLDKKKYEYIKIGEEFSSALTRIDNEYDKFFDDLYADMPEITNEKTNNISDEQINK